MSGEGARVVLELRWTALELALSTGFHCKLGASVELGCCFCCCSRVVAAVEEEEEEEVVS